MFFRKESFRLFEKLPYKIEMAQILPVVASRLLIFTNHTLTSIEPVVPFEYLELVRHTFFTASNYFSYVLAFISFCWLSIDISRTINCSCSQSYHFSVSAANRKGTNCYERLFAFIMPNLRLFNFFECLT